MTVTFLPSSSFLSAMMKLRRVLRAKNSSSVYRSCSTKFNISSDDRATSGGSCGFGSPTTTSPPGGTRGPPDGIRAAGSSPGGIDGAGGVEVDGAGAGALGAGTGSDGAGTGSD